MIKILKFNSKYVYDLTHIVHLFFEKVEWVNEFNQQGNELLIKLNDNEANVSLFFDGKEKIILKDKNNKNSIKRMVYEVLSKVKESKSKYGILVGVRPVKVVHKLLDENYSFDDIEVILRDIYKISNKKINLLIEVAKKERKYLENDIEVISLYIGIPFCPSICTYCSFPSNDITKKSKIVETYISKLCEEIDYVFNLLNKNKRYVDNIYIGGGTPTSIKLDQLERILESLSNNIDLEKIKEFTIEAGRPDTIDKDKLRLMKKYFVNRICLNPQTSNDDVLKIIGRGHSNSDTIAAMKLISEYKFDSINMDLIVGLPGDDFESVKKTIHEVISMKPTNITVHTLAIKKASDLNRNKDKYKLLDATTIEKMLEEVSKQLKANEYLPYYLYRQKNILGNFENIGYSVKDKESIYNIRIIEERHNILALGVGGVSKKMINKNLGFKRIPNFRSVEDYINRFDEMLAKKDLFLNLTSNE